MDELLELRKYVEQHQYTEALGLIAEMEEMSHHDKVNKIYSFARILLIHLIKQMAEKRTTRSWDISIKNAVQQIRRTNQHRKSAGSYLSQAELVEIINEAYDSALSYASLEAFGGIYDETQLGNLVDQKEIQQKALILLNIVKN